VDPLNISRLAEARELNVCVLIESGRPNQNYAKVGHRGSGSCNLLLIFEPPRISGMAEAGHPGACSVCTTFYAAFAKLLKPLVHLLCNSVA